MGRDFWTKSWLQGCIVGNILIVLLAFVVLVGAIAQLTMGFLDTSMTIGDWQKVNPVAINTVDWTYGWPLWLYGLENAFVAVVLIGYSRVVPKKIHKVRVELQAH